MAAPRAAWADEDGFKIGAGRLHPFFDFETRYDTAAQLTTNAQGATQYDPDLILHFRPGLKLEVPSDIVAISLNGAVEYLYYTGLTAPVSPGLDRFQGEGALNINILQGSTVGVNLGDHLTRSSQTTNPGLPYGVLSLYNDASIGVPITPGQGSLTITPGYHFILEDYQSLLNIPEASNFVPADLNYFTHQFTLQNRWRFLPKTAILLDGEYDIRDYTTAGSGNTGLQYFMATTGIAGLLTPHLATIARIGYGMDVLHSSVSGLNGIIGQLEVSWLPNEVTTLRLGVSRDFSALASQTGTGVGAIPASENYVSYIDTRPYLGARTLLFERLALHGLVSLDYLNYEGAGTVARSDLMFLVDVGADFEAFRWFTVSLGDTFANRTSTQAGLGLNFTDEQIYLRLSFHY